MSDDLSNALIMFGVGAFGGLAYGGFSIWNGIVGGLFGAGLAIAAIVQKNR